MADDSYLFAIRFEANPRARIVLRNPTHKPTSLVEQRELFVVLNQFP